MVKGHQVALEDMGTRLGLLEIKAGAAGDDVDLVVDVVLQHLAQAQAFGNAVDKC